MDSDIHWLEHAGQRLGLVPRLGGAVAAWQALTPEGAADLWRPWDGRSEDLYKLASFAMLPWSNRIARGGFEHRGRWYDMSLNRIGEPYPIHGDGWLQPWAITQPDAASLEMTLASRHHAGGPYAYDATQRFTLVESGLDQSVSVTHRGEAALPYGLGLHPWFARDAATQVMARVDGVWLAGADPIPVRHSHDMPPSWDLSEGAPMQGSLIDNGYTGWDGRARITWPERQRAVDMRMLPLETPRGPVAPQWCLVYRPPVGEAFCFEPITQPINAFHMAGPPGLVELAEGQALTLNVQWRFQRGIKPARS